MCSRERELEICSVEDDAAVGAMFLFAPADRRVIHFLCGWNSLPGCSDSLCDGFFFFYLEFSIRVFVRGLG